MPEVDALLSIVLTRLTSDGEIEERTGTSVNP
jgi:hypothetical protein